MEKIFFIIFGLLATAFQLAINFFFTKKKILLNYSGLKHQVFTNSKTVPLSGGFLILLTSIPIFFHINNFFPVFLFFIFLSGIFGDLKKNISPKLRFIFQLFLVTVFVIGFDLGVDSLRIHQLDNLLNSKIFFYGFSILCLLVLINGTNFIDGCNTLVIGYYLVVFYILYHTGLVQLIFSDDNIRFLLIILLIIFIFNFFEKLYLGDSGSYLIAFLFGIIILLLYKANNLVSPYFLANLLWYPSFEVLFSIFRKLKFNFSALNPDTQHFHQLLFFFFKKKIKIYSKNLFLINSLAGFAINIYNLLIFSLISERIFDTKLQVIFLIVNIIIYCFVYIRLQKFYAKNLKNLSYNV